jgi:hypothetical protein
MARGRRTSYTRDNSGRFASSPGGGAPKRSTPATRRAATRAGNRLNRDNSGRISGIGRDGATVRGGRLKTAKGNRRATQLASMKAAPLRSGTIAKGGRGVRGSVARSLAAVRKERAGALGLSRARPGQVGRALARAQANDRRLLRPAMRGTEARTKAGVGLAVSRGAQDYYAGKMPRRKATFSPLTSSRDKKALAARRKRVVDNTKTAKPAATRKPKPRKPVNNKPKRSLAVRVAKADKADRKLAAQLKQAKASGNLKKENELIRRRQRIDRFNKTYNFADLKASRKALTPTKPTAPKRTRASRLAGTVAKPRGMNPGVLAVSRARKKMNGIEAERIRINNMPTMNEAKVKALLAANHAVFVYPRRKEVRVDGGKAVKVSKEMAQKLSKVVKGPTRKP